jgi:hypothetical protein
MKTEILLLGEVREGLREEREMRGVMRVGYLR